MIDKIFPGVKLHATDRKGATKARYSGKRACSYKREGTVNLRLLAAEGLPSGAGPRQQRVRTSSLRGRIQVGHCIRAPPRKSDE